MAIRVGYFENTTNCYSEGPFVMVNACGWRIEVKHEGHHCPALPDSSIYGFIRDQGLPDGKYEEALAACIVDFLNAKVKDGTIVLDPKHKITWIWEPYEGIMEMKRWEEKRAKLAAQERCDSDGRY
jgi:hypothetical protein